MISLIHPANSWVAKYNQGSKRIPGVYAIHVFSDNEVIRSGQQYSEEEDDGFIARDDEDLD